MEWLGIGLSVFVLTQWVCIFGALVFLGILIYREHCKGNDLTYWEFWRLLFICVVSGSLGVFLPLFLWGTYQLAKNEASDLSAHQPNSVYSVVVNERILLRGSAGAKTLRALTEDWE
jgi:hypothetical protein